MPQFTDSVVIPVASAVLFRLLRTPVSLALLAPPELHLEVIAAPPLLELGSRVELKGRRWGMAHFSVVEITALEMDTLLIEEQRAGLFRLWKHSYRLEILSPTRTRLGDEVTFEPPGGMVGFVVTAAAVQRDMAAFVKYRNRRLLELFHAGDDPAAHAAGSPTSC
jgi:hypothetical protein